MKYSALVFAFVFTSCSLFALQQSDAQINYGSSPYWDGVNAPIIGSPVINSSTVSSRNYYPYVVARPADRAWLQQTPMEYRPNRPLHFWGNTVRRRSDVSMPTFSPATSYSLNRFGGGVIFRR